MCTTHGIACCHDAEVEIDEGWALPHADDLYWVAGQVFSAWYLHAVLYYDYIFWFVCLVAVDGRYAVEGGTVVLDGVTYHAPYHGVRCADVELVMCNVVDGAIVCGHLVQHAVRVGGGEY